MSESKLLKDAQVSATNHGGRLFRNNSGLARNASGHWIRFGVGNPGGSDLIGWMPRVITEADVGKTFAIFFAVECKSTHGRLTYNQERFIELVNKSGGRALSAKTLEQITQAMENL